MGPSRESERLKLECIKDPIVSVVMPCFNAAATIDQAVASVLEGDLESIELIAVDDGSQDGTVDRLLRWAEQDRRLRPIIMEHRGIIAALNRGWQEASGKLIGRMDADDYSYPERFAAQVACLNADAKLAAVGSLVEAFPPADVSEGFQVYLDWLNRLITPEQISREIYIESPLVHPSVLIRRIWLERVGGYIDRGWPEDYDLWLRIDREGGQFAKVPDVLFSWREHPDRLTRTDNRYSVRNFLRAKAHYLMAGPLADRDAVLIWGAGQMGRRISKHLLERGAPIVAFIDVDQAKIGRSKRGRPVVAREELMDWWSRYQHPALLAAVGSHAARGLIREYLANHGLVEGRDWWAAA
ncbi:MAG: glycosyltransferase [Anaerolineales bacterium]